MAPVAPIFTVCHGCLASHLFSVQGDAFSLQTLGYLHGTCWQVLKAQLDRDQVFANLTMESVYHEEVIMKILKQAVEYASIFIRENTGHEFGGRKVRKR